MTPIPPNFQVPESAYRYCERKGWPPALADYFIDPFRRYFRETRTPHKSWNKTFTMWLWRASPLCRGYASREWEAALDHAKRNPRIATELEQFAEKMAQGSLAKPPQTRAAGGVGRRNHDPALARRLAQEQDAAKHALFDQVLQREIAKRRKRDALPTPKGETP